VSHKRNPSKIRLTEHFIDRWHERIGRSRESKIKSILHAALREEVVLGMEGDRFGVWVYGSVAVLVLEERGYWRALTVLGPEGANTENFKNKREAVRQ